MLSLFDIFSSEALDFKDEKRPYGTQCFILGCFDWMGRCRFPMEKS